MKVKTGYMDDRIPGFLYVFEQKTIGITDGFR